MSNRSPKSIEFKRLLRQYEFAMQDLEDLKDIQSSISADFNTAVASLKRQDLFENKDIEQMAKDQTDVDADKEEPERDPSFKKLFRKIVVKCHPDRLGSDISKREAAEMKEHYENAVKSNDEYNWALLIMVAIRLEIELDEDYYEQIESLRSETKKLEEEAKKIQGSVAWTWYHAEEEARENILGAYIKHMEKAIALSKATKVKILGVGHPRTGTGYTSKLLNAWGLKVGHEVLDEDGIVAWQLAVEVGPWPYITTFNTPVKSDIIIYNVRNPRESLASIIFTENTKSISMNFRKRNGVHVSTNRVETAINSLIAWDRKIRALKPKPMAFRIEDQQKELFDFLVSKGLKVEWVDFTQKVNTRYHAKLTELEEELKKVRPSIKMRLNEYCRNYGYEPLFT
jgi:hypothetical protein